MSSHCTLNIKQSKSLREIWRVIFPPNRSRLYVAVRVVSASPSFLGVGLDYCE